MFGIGKPSAAEIAELNRRILLYFKQGYQDKWYKGEVRSGLVAHGVGVAAEASVDAGKALLGLATLEVSLKGGARGAGQRMMIATYGPPSSTHRYILNYFRGFLFEGDASVGAEIGIGASVEAGISAGGYKTGKHHLSAGGTASAGNTKDGGIGAERKGGYLYGGDREITDGAGLASAKASAKVSVSAGLSGAATHYHAEADAILFCTSYSEAETALQAMFATGDEMKATFKKWAVSLINDYPPYFHEKVSYGTFGHISTQKLLDVLRPGIDRLRNAREELARASRHGQVPAVIGLPANSELRRLDEALARATTVKSALEGIQDLRRPAYVSMSTLKGTFESELSASAGLEAAGIVASAEASAKYSAYTINMSHKASRIKVQGCDSSGLFWTQKTYLHYNTIDNAVGKGEVKAQVKLKGTALVPEEYSGKDAAPVEWKYNWLSYSSAVIYWENPFLIGTGGRSAPEAARKEVREVVAQRGSGVSFGRSYSLTQLWSCYDIDSRVKGAPLMDRHGKTDKDQRDELPSRGSSAAAGKPEGRAAAPQAGGAAPQDYRKVMDPSRMHAVKGKGLVRQIAGDLKVSEEAVVSFLNDKHVRMCVFEFWRQSAFAKLGDSLTDGRWSKEKGVGEFTLVLESAFRLSGPQAPKPKVQVNTCTGHDNHQYPRPRLVDDLLAPARGYSSFDAFLDHPLFKKSKDSPYHNDWSEREGNLECIRLRVRQATMENNDRDLFQLGAIIAGTGVKFTLQEVDRFAIGGFVELRTVFLKRSGGTVAVVEESNSGPSYEKIQDQAVPPAALYCQ